MSLDEAPLPLPSASAISVTATSGLHVVRLSGYSHAKLLLGAGEFVESAAFKAAGHSWRVKVYPNGAGSIALYLVLAGEPKADVHAQFQFSLLRHGSKLTLTHDSGRITDRPVTFNANTRGWGFDNLVEEPDHDHLKDDTILIRCDITVLKERRHDLGTLDLLRDCNDGTTVQETPLQPSASTIAVTASTGCHVVKVSGYAQTKLLPGNGNRIKSAKFKEAGHAWRIWCYPDGDRRRPPGTSRSTSSSSADPRTSTPNTSSAWSSTAN
ncbi:hypothetical protein C2845_PM15G24960 [Panicum miliaceum]|uniref:MATH domain-containing protein n=1 Tax=Panicum miliaceum TaxID=4540 RepID=A0A3L6Q6R4_PANMI|nr:hypothetical protein C2845_PM15G24960 [Panicum miliaceum]